MLQVAGCERFSTCNLQREAKQPQTLTSFILIFVLHLLYEEDSTIATNYGCSCTC